MPRRKLKERAPMLPSVKDIAQTLGFTERSVRAWLTGQRSIPILKLNAILNAFPYLDARYVVSELSLRFKEKAPPTARGYHVEADSGIGSAIRSRRTLRKGRRLRPKKA